MQKVSKYFKVLKKYFTSFYSAIAEVGSPISTAITEPLYTSEEFLISLG
ncbi:28337_t:CDS:1, partial [Gigaspora margarita]